MTLKGRQIKYDVRADTDYEICRAGQLQAKTSSITLY